MTAVIGGRRPAGALVVVLVWLVVLAASAWQIARTPFTADLTAFLPATPDDRQRTLIDQLERGLPSRTLMVGLDGGDAVQRAAVSRTMAATLRTGDLFEQVHNGETDAMADIGRWLVEHRYALSPGVAPERFTAEGLRDAIDETLSLLGTPAGAAVRPLLERDPTGETVRIGESLIPSSAPRTEEGVWVSRTAERAVMLLVVRATGADLDAQQRAVEAVRAAHAMAAAGTPVTLRLTGTPLFSVESRASIEQEVKWLAIAGTVAASVLLLVAFGSVKALSLSVLPVATGVVVGIAAVGLGYGQVHGLTLGFGSTLIGEAVDYAIYYLIQSSRGRSAGGAAPGFRHWLATGWPVVRLGLATSLCGFAALLFSDFPGLGQLGLFSVAGLVAAALTTRWLLPLLAPDGSDRPGLRRPLGRAMRAMLAALPRLRWVALAAGAAGLAVLVARADLWQGNLSRLSTVAPEQLALDESLRADLTGVDAGLLVVVRGPDLQATLERTEAATRVLESRVDARQLAGFSSVTRLLPSERTQATRLAALPAEPALRAALAEATRGGPLPASRLEPFVAEVQRARTAAPVTRDTLPPAAAALVGALLQPRSDGGWTALLPLEGADPALDVAALDRALAAVPQAQALSVGPELNRLYDHYLREATVQSLLGAVAVLALVAVALRSLRRLRIVVPPLLLAVVITGGALAAIGTPMGILHLVGLLFVVAVGSNYALFFAVPQGEGGGDGEPDDDTLASLLLANVTTVVSFGLIAVSDIPALAAIGSVVAPGAALALVLAAVFAPAPGATREVA